MSVKPFVTIFLLAAPFAAGAQHARNADTVLKGSTIEVLQSYKPRVKQSPKPGWIPQLPPADTSHPVFNYDVPQQALNYTYNSLPLRPLALGKNIEPLPFQNYVKAGAGNLSTIYADAGIGGIHGDNYETGLHLHHKSQKSGIKNQQTSLSGAEADGIFHNDAGDWHVSLAGARNQYYYYGYDHVLHDYPADSVKQIYTSIRATVDMQNKPDSNSRLYYHPAINASYYNARFKTSELSLGLDAPVTYRVDSTLDLLLGLKGALTNYKSDTVTASNNYVELLPGLDIKTRHFTGHALLGLALGKSKGYILPDLLASYKVPSTRFTMSLGYMAALRQNTYEQLTTENPYMRSQYQVQQRRSDEVFAQFAGSVGDHFSYSARISWWSFANMATFLNDTPDGKQFHVEYEDAKAISFQMGARYTVANVWSAGIAADYYAFNNISQPYLWHVPSLRIKADVMAHPIPKLTTTAYITVLGGMHARDLAFNNITLKTFADIGLGGEYQIIPRVSAFLDINNLLNNKYERWYMYPAYGLNIYGGLRLKF